MYPNPFQTSTTIEIINQNIYLNNCEFKIYDVLGQVVLKSEIKNQKSEIQRGNLKNGIYFYQLKNENKIIGTGKLMVE